SGSAPVPAPESRNGAAGSETILVVEDQERLREGIGVVLRSFGYQGIAARDATDAGRVAEGHAGPVHLLLTHVGRPRTSGPILAERIRALRPEVKVVYMSGYAPDAMTRHGSLAADAAFLQKPFGPDELEKAMRTALGR